MNRFVQEMKDRGMTVDARTMAFVRMNPDETCYQCGRPTAFDPVIGMQRHKHDRVIPVLCEDEPED